MRIFVGYGGSKAQRVAKMLTDFFQQQEDWETFKAPEEVPIGEWEPSALTALKKADVFVVVYSKGSWRSQNLWKEVVLAEEWGITIFPIVQKDLRLDCPLFPTILHKQEVMRFDPKQPKRCKIKVFSKLRKFELTLLYTPQAAQAFLRKPVGL